MKALLILILLYLVLSWAGCWDMRRATAPPHPPRSGAEGGP